jgi:hypothetical protein
MGQALASLRDQPSYESGSRLRAGGTRPLFGRKSSYSPSDRTTDRDISSREERRRHSHRHKTSGEKSSDRRQRESRGKDTPTSKQKEHDKHSAKTKDKKRNAHKETSKAARANRKQKKDEPKTKSRRHAHPAGGEAVPGKYQRPRQGRENERRMDLDVKLVGPRFIDLGPTRNCVVCTEDQLLHEFPPRPPTSQCEHEVNTCKWCLMNWIMTQFETKIWNVIGCPECNARMQYDDIREFATKSVFRR